MRCIISFLLASTAALAEVPAVVTDIPPVQSLVAAVMGDLGQPVLLLDRGASPHSFQLRPSQARAVAEADLVVWIGPGLTPWLEKPLANRPKTAAALGLLAAEGTHRQEFGATGATDHDEEGHDHRGTDPHAWLDPDNGRHWLKLIAAELSRLDPENAPAYAANVKTAAAAIDKAEAEATAILAPVKDQPFIAFHDAYGYYTAHFGLTLAGTVALGDAVSPGARHLAALRDSIARGAAPCIFPEVQHNPALVAQMAEGSGIAVGPPLDPSGSVLEPGSGLYPELIRSLAASLAACPP